MACTFNSARLLAIPTVGLCFQFCGVASGQLMRMEGRATVIDLNAGDDVYHERIDDPLQYTNQSNECHWADSSHALFTQAMAANIVPSRYSRSLVFWSLAYCEGTLPTAFESYGATTVTDDWTLELAEPSQFTLSISSLTSTIGVGTSETNCDLTLVAIGDGSGNGPVLEAPGCQVTHGDQGPELRLGQLLSNPGEGDYSVTGTIGRGRVRILATTHASAVALTPGYVRAFARLSVNALFGSPCAADLGMQGGVYGQDGRLDSNDLIAFIDLFFLGDNVADVGNQQGNPGSDGVFDNNDFAVYIDRFFAGC